MRAEGRPVEPSPLRPGRYDVDRWSRRWSLFFGVLLVVGSFLPSARFRPFPYELRAVWPWQLGETENPFERWLPLAVLAAGVVSLLSLRIRRSARRAAALTGAGALVALTFGGVLLTRYSSLPRLPPDLLREIRCAMISETVWVLALWFLAAGLHLRHHHVRALEPRILAGLGGAVLLLFGFLPDPWPGPFAEIPELDQAVPIGILTAILLYGVAGLLGAVLPFRVVAEAGRWLARLVLAAFPIAMVAWIVQTALSDPEGTLLLAVSSIRSYLHGLGAVALVPLGACVFVETELDRRALARQLREVFD
jgi:hypothetical protein